MKVHPRVTVCEPWWKIVTASVGIVLMLVLILLAIYVRVHGGTTPLNGQVGMALAFALIVLSVACASIDMRVTADTQSCVRCSYPIEDTEHTQICPECGSDMTVTGNAAKQWPWRRYERKVIGAILGSVGAIVLIVLWIITYVST